MAFPHGLGSGRVAWVETHEEGVGRWPGVLYNTWGELAASGITVGAWAQDEVVGMVRIP